MPKRMRRVALSILSTLAILIVSFGIVTPASAATYGPEKLVHSSGYCVEAPTPYLGQQVILNYCGGPASHNQHFTFEDAGFVAWQYFIHLEGSPYCLQPGAPDLYNSTIVLWTCNPLSTAQIWILGFPHYPNTTDRDLANSYNARCIDTPPGEVPVAGSYLRATGCLRGWYNLYYVS